MIKKASIDYVLTSFIVFLMSPRTQTLSGGPTMAILS